MTDTGSTPGTNSRDHTNSWGQQCFWQAKSHTGGHQPDVEGHEKLSEHARMKETGWKKSQGKWAPEFNPGDGMPFFPL